MRKKTYLERGEVGRQSKRPYLLLLTIFCLFSFFSIAQQRITCKIENRPIYNMDVFLNMNTSVKTYTPLLLLQKNTYRDKMNQLPVATSEIQRNKGTLAQTPGW